MKSSIIQTFLIIIIFSTTWQSLSADNNPVTSPVKSSTSIPENSDNKSVKTKKKAKATVRLYAEYYEVSTIEYAQIIAQEPSETDNSELRNKLYKMATLGKAKLVDSQLLSGNTGQWLTTQSVAEFIHPREYDTPSHTIPHLNSYKKTVLPVAFESRELGTRLKAISTIALDGSIDTAFTSEIVTHIGETHWGRNYNDTSIAQPPTFYTTRIETHLSLPAKEKFILVGTFTPLNNNKVPDRSKKLVYFIKASVIKK